MRGMPSRLLLRSVLSLGLGLAGLALASSPATAGGATSWVSGVGDDVNPCTRTAPCKTFTGAMAKTDDGGTIMVLDPGNFGAFSITKSVTIDGNGVAAYINANGGGSTAITIGAPAGSKVVIRNLAVRGFAYACDTAGGVLVNSVGSLLLDHVSIDGVGIGVDVPLAAATAPAAVSLRHVSLADDCQGAVRAAPTVGHAAKVALDDVSVSTSGVGLSFGPGAEGWVTRSNISFNGVGLQVQGGAVHSVCDNVVAGNGVNGAFTDDLCGGAAVTAPNGSATAYCTVPKLKKKTTAQATDLLTKAGCATGKVKKQSGPKSKKGKVVSQDIVAGALVKLGTKVGLVVGK